MVERDLDVVIVGGGCAGIYLLHRLRAMGLRACVLEAGGDVDAVVANGYEDFVLS